MIKRKDDVSQKDLFLNIDLPENEIYQFDFVNATP